MAEKMRKGIRYRIDHPMFDQHWLIDNELYPKGSGFIGRNGMGFYDSGTLHFSGNALPRHLHQKIAVRGLIVTFPDGQEFSIYEEGQEPPSGKVGRERVLSEMLSRRDASINELLQLFENAIGSNFNARSKELIVGLVHQFERRSDAERASPRIDGICIGLQMAGLISPDQLTDFRNRLKELMRHGEELSRLKLPFGRG